MILTDEEVFKCLPPEENALEFARSIEAAVLEKLAKQGPVATVEKGPGYWSRGHYYDEGKKFISAAVIDALPVGTNLYATPVPAAVLEKLKQQEPVAWMVRNGVVDHQLFWSKQQADALCAEMQKRHDLSGSLARFSVAPLYAAPVPSAVPDDVVKQRDELLSVLKKIVAADDEAGADLLAIGLPLPQNVMALTEEARAAIASVKEKR